MALLEAAIGMAMMQGDSPVDWWEHDDQILLLRIRSYGTCTRTGDGITYSWPSYVSMRTGPLYASTRTQ